MLFQDGPPGSAPAPSSGEDDERSGRARPVLGRLIVLAAALGLAGLGIASYTTRGHLPIPGMITAPPPDIFSVTAGPQVPAGVRKGAGHCVNAQHGYRFDFPEGWTLHQPPQYNEHRARMLLNPSLMTAAVVVVPFETSSTSPRDELAKVEQTYLGQPNAALEERPMQLNGMSGFLRQYGLQVDTQMGPTDFKVAAAYLFKDKQCVAVFMRASDDEFDKSRPALDMVLSTLALEKMSIGSGVQPRKDVRLTPFQVPGAAASGAATSPFPGTRLNETSRPGAAPPAAGTPSGPAGSQGTPSPATSTPASTSPSTLPPTSATVPDLRSNTSATPNLPPPSSPVLAVPPSPPATSVPPTPSRTP